MCMCLTFKPQAGYPTVLGPSLEADFSEVPKLAPTQNLSEIFSALSSPPLISALSSQRPLHLMLEALEKGLPSWWNESYWQESAGGPHWEPPVPVTSTMTRTTTSTMSDLYSLLCTFAELEKCL